MGFHGRQDELALLRQYWDSCTQRKSPSIVTLLGESGIGKTRLVREFFQRLVNDPQWNPPEHDFWPTDATSVAILATDPLASEHVASGPPQFLWLGLDCTHIPLDNLLEQIEAQRQLYLRFQAPLKRLGQGMRQSIDPQRWTSFYNQHLASVVHTVLSPVAKSDDEATPETFAQQVVMSNVAQQIVAVSPLPVFIFLDNVDRLSQASQQAIAHFVRTALKQDWPIMLVATHHNEGWADLPDDYIWKETLWFEVSPAKEVDAFAYLAEHFSGLTVDHIEYILQNANGNFRILHEYINELRGNPSYFVNNDFGQTLSITGNERLRTWQSPHQRILAQRHRDEQAGVEQLLQHIGHLNLDLSFLLTVVMRQNPKPLLRLLDEALELWLSEAFDAQGELQSSGNNTLADLPVTHQQMLTTLGHLRLPINGRSWLQATVMACISYSKQQQWSHLTQYASTLDSVDWRQHAGITIGWQTLEQLAAYLQQAGSYTMANLLYDTIADHEQPTAELVDKIDVNERYAKTLRTMVQNTQPQKNATRTLELLERSLEPLRSLARTRISVDDLRNVTQTLLQIGQIYEKRGLPQVAAVAEPYFGEMLMHQRNRLKPENRANADTMYADAITISQEAQRYANQLVETLQTTPNTHQLVGALGQLSRLQRGANQISDALNTTQEWLLWHRQMSSGAITPTSRRTQIGILIQLAELHLVSNNVSEAIATLTEAMGMSQSLRGPGETPADILQRSMIVSGHSRCALLSGDRNRALEVAIELLNMRRTLANQAPSMVHLRHLLSAMHMTGQLLGQLNYHNEARNLANEAQQIANQAFRTIPPVKVRYDIAVLRNWSQFVG